MFLENCFLNLILESIKTEVESPTTIAALAACTLMKRISRMTFEEKGRSMLTTDIIPNISVKFGSQIFLQKKLADLFVMISKTGFSIY